MARKPIKKRTPRKVGMGASRPKIRIRSADRYEFDPNIVPLGQVYQWIAIDVMGEKQDISRAMADGWKPVPFDRHHQVFADSNNSGRIIIGGLMLVENTREVADANLGANTLEAQWQIRHSRFFGQAGRLTLSSPFLAPQVPSVAILGEYRIPHEAPLDVEVSILLRLTPRQLDIADHLNITPQEYGQRVAKMLPLVRVNSQCYGVPNLFKDEIERELDWNR